MTRSWLAHTPNLLLGNEKQKDLSAPSGLQRLWDSPQTLQAEPQKLRIFFPQPFYSVSHELNSMFPDTLKLPFALGLTLGYNSPGSGRQKYSKERTHLCPTDKDHLTGSLRSRISLAEDRLNILSQLPEAHKSHTHMRHRMYECLARHHGQMPEHIRSNERLLCSRIHRYTREITL